MSELEIPTARWAVPLLAPARYKGGHGGRGSGKSHFFAELMVEEHVADPHQQSVCIREIQKSLKFSSKKLLESKIESLGVSHLFDVTLTEIRRVGGAGIIIFQGMQDHTADSIKSLEGFHRAWVEEAQNLSARSLQLLRPTIRAPGSQLWFSWNPEKPTDAVDAFLRGPNAPRDSIVVEVNFLDNPFPSDALRDEFETDRVSLDPETFHHVWEGGYNVRSKAQIFAGKWRVDEFEPGKDWDGPYHGLDFGFADDPTAAVKLWIHGKRLYIEHESGKRGLELDHTADYIERDIPGIRAHAVRADSARPESISYLKRHGMPRIGSVKKWAGSVEDGIEHIRSYAEVIVHTRCKQTAQEFRLYSYKVDKNSGDVLPVIVDDHNHFIDAIRYGLEPLIRTKRKSAGVL